MLNNTGMDDLTTDAIPSPPRAVLEGDKEKSKTRHSAKSTSAKKTRKFTTDAGNVINISNSNGVHIGPNYNVYMNNTSKDKEENLDQNKVMTPSIAALLCNEEVVNKKHILKVSQHINEKWRDTARSLNYSNGQISQFYENHKESGIKEVIYKLLIDWMENEADHATVGKLSTVLWQTSQQEAVERWAKKFL